MTGMAEVTREQMLVAAERRYVYDAEFHYKVDLAVEVVAPADAVNRQMAIHAAAAALLIEESGSWRT